VDATVLDKEQEYKDLRGLKDQQDQQGQSDLRVPQVLSDKLDLKVLLVKVEMLLLNRWLY
jgi:hypothetical protein